VNLQHHRDVEFEAAAPDDDIRRLCGRSDEVKKQRNTGTFRREKKQSNEFFTTQLPLAEL
jgi:hypothetical protein